MKSLLSVFFLLAFTFAKAQKDSNIVLDQLQVPSSPAFSLLGISPNSIERPKNPTDFALAVGNATAGFSALPKDYAIEFSPYWVFKKKQTTFADFKANTPGKNILQTATISTATTSAISQVDTSAFRKIAVAVKFSIFRGELRDEFKRWNDSVTHYLNRVSEILGQAQADATIYDSKMISYRAALRNALDKKLEEDIKKWEEAIRVRQDELVAESIKKQDSVKQYTDAVANLKALASRTDFRRYGFKLDFAAGTAVDYPDSSFQTCYVSKLSSWLTMGWETPDFNLLAVARISDNLNHTFRNSANKVVTNINIGEVDYGFRFYKDFAEKFTLSFEYVKRQAMYDQAVLKRNNVQLPASSSRYVLSMNYKVGKNQNLSFVYGKNFDNTYVKQGNLIAALHFLVGFGSSRPFVGK